MTDNIMIDIETMGTDIGAPILSIGAARFSLDPDTEITDTFHVGIELESAMAIGLKPSASTILWWLGPERNDARKELAELPKTDIESALFGFSEWVGQDFDHIKFWGNSAAFDLGLLGRAYDLLRLPKPWHFWNERCYRTVKNVWPMPMQRVGTHHSAVDDALSQAMHLREILAGIGAGKE